LPSLPPCESAANDVYLGVTTNVAAVEPTDLAYQRAYDEHWPDVFRFALAWTNDWAAAEDLAQEAYLRLWNQRKRLDWSRPALPWLLVTTRRLATDRFRQLRRRISPAPPPESLNENARDRWLDVSAAMATLSPLERSALVMTALEGLSYDKASEILNSTPGALRAAVSRARTKLEAAR
jgi:RNA polymerase sigma-70 factor (ECF subfamily)